MTEPEIRELGIRVTAAIEAALPKDIRYVVVLAAGDYAAIGGALVLRSNIGVSIGAALLLQTALDGIHQAEAKHGSMQ